MKNYKYQLEKYKGKSTRFQCPDCKKNNVFVRYTDLETGNYLADNVGRCNREGECGYHYTPQQFFTDNGKPQDYTPLMKCQKIIPKPISYLPDELINDDFKNNYFYDYLISKFDTKNVNEVMKRYQVGSSNHWSKSIVFYQFDKYQRCRTGKVMQFDSFTGKRIKKPYNRINWIHTKIDGFNLKQCLFGEHLYRLGMNSTIGIVESEKTAIIMAIVKPDIVWMATSGLGNLSINTIKRLPFVKIVLYPDSGCADKWESKVKGMKNVQLFRGLESCNDGSDLADHLECLK